MENLSSRHMVTKRIGELFEIQSGDFHATSELDPGNIPLISCGTNNNGLVGYFDIPEQYIYRNAITVAYNGLPLTAKFHPYAFGAKDDVAVLLSRQAMKETSLLYIAAALNRTRWRYSYGRKCFREKLKRVEVSIPTMMRNGEVLFDEEAIEQLFPKGYHDFLPQKSDREVTALLHLAWHTFNILELFDLKRGDFHSIADLDPGSYITVSRVTDMNGVVGYYDLPDGAQVYGRGYITISTVGGDTFVQLDDFIATDNVIICTPKTELRITTLFFIVFMLNHQKWRYSYGRQCYLEKLERVNIYLPVMVDGHVDEDTMEQIVTHTSYWPYLQKRFGDKVLFSKSESNQLQQIPLPLTSV